jgi:hypothetical protein
MPIKIESTRPMRFNIFILLVFKILSNVVLWEATCQVKSVISNYI